ncbi:hypothetical protein N7G274_008755 [Stereocaulon virgatum]|uniref:Uncharacterized protein n=1 Tax=Stereocaulon virgatum TaxID=373712 RepID=A0ABR4A0A3_9LECA
MLSKQLHIRFHNPPTILAPKHTSSLAPSSYPSSAFESPDRYPNTLCTSPTPTSHGSDVDSPRSSQNAKHRNQFTCTPRKSRMFNPPVGNVMHLYYFPDAEAFGNDCFEATAGNRVKGRRRSIV